LNTAQQIGGALGLAVLSTIATSAANDKLPDAATTLYRALATKDFALAARAGEAVTHGYTMAFAAAGAMFLAGLVVTALAINAQRQHTETDADAPAAHMG
ncbi:MFS transporter, partial [Streptomyces sp. MCAF7]